MFGFVQIDVYTRYFFIAFFVVLWLLSFGFNALTGEFSRIVLFCSFSLYLLVLLFPFIAPNIFKSYFNPIFFYFLWEIIQGVFKLKLFLGILSIEGHYAFPGALQSELNLLLAESFILESLALLFLLVGFFIPFNVSFSKLAIPKTNYLKVKSLFWMLLACVGLFKLMNIGGGIQTVLIQRGLPDEDRISSQIGSHWHFLASIGRVIPVVWMACNDKVSKKIYFWFFVGLSLVLFFVTTGSRSGTITPLILLGIVYSIQNHKLPYKAILLGGFISLVLVGFMGQFREATRKVQHVEQINIEKKVSELIGFAISDMRTRGVENNGQLAVLANVPKDVPHLQGKSYLSIPFVFFPSAIFGEKPDSAGKLNAKLVYNRFDTAIPPGVVGEAYWNYSYIGVCMVFLVYGFILKIFYDFFIINFSHPFIMVMYVYSLLYFRPGSDQIFNFFHVIVPVAFIYISFIRFRLRFA